MDKFYNPQEDSYLLLDESIKYLKNKKNKDLKICEVGVGSGFVISNISKEFPKNLFFGCDINKEAIKKIYKLIIYNG